MSDKGRNASDYLVTSDERNMNDLIREIRSKASDLAYVNYQNRSNMFGQTPNVEDNVKLAMSMMDGLYEIRDLIDVALEDAKYVKSRIENQD